MRKLRVALALVSVVSISLAAPQGGDGEPARDGAWLYTRNCAGCHNDNGDGRGATILGLGLTARDFKQGGFAFGDTREAMLRTISTGIPGRSPMPSFRGILSEEEMGLVVDHVRTLMPPRADEAPANTEMIVRDRPVIARGKLPPIVDGAKETVRGLLIGTPEGMTFEYDASDVRLLGVRLGRFADRTDWGGRGGSYLQPLGVLVWRAADGMGRISVSDAARAERLPKPPFTRRIRSSWVRGGVAGITYECIDSSGQPFAAIDETLCVDTTSIGPAFTRTWKCTPEPGIGTLTIDVVDGESAHTTGPPERSRFARDCGESGMALSFPRGPLSSLQIGSVTDRETGLTVGSAREFEVGTTVVMMREWTLELERKLAQELGL